MRKWLIRTLFLAISGQSLLYFGLGQRFELRFGNRYWEPLHLALFLILWVWLITYPLERRFSSKTPSTFPRLLKFLYAFSGVILLLSIYRGVALGYRTVLSDAEMLFWPLIFVPIGWSLQVEHEEWKHLLRLLLLPALLLSVLTVPFILSKTLGVTAHGFLHYNEYFLVALGFLFYFTRVILLRSCRFSDRLALFLTTLATGLTFNKAVIIPLLSAIFFLFLFKNRKQMESGKSAIKRLLSFSLPLIYGLILVLLISPSSSFTRISDYYHRQWESRVLHADTGDISGGRFSIWERSWFYIQREPWLGYGLGARFVKIGNDSLELTGSTGLGTHNQYLHLVTALGLPGAGVVLVTLVYFLTFMIKVIDLNEMGDDKKQIILTLWGFIWLMLTYGLVSLWNTSSVGYTLVGLFMGVVLRMSVPLIESREAHRLALDTTAVSLRL